MRQEEEKVRKQMFLMVFLLAMLIVSGLSVPETKATTEVVEAINCQQYQQACTEFASEWYASCEVLGGYDCHCRSLHLFNGCMEAHGCEGISNAVMVEQGCDK
jgi:hypothetical protein